MIKIVGIFFLVTGFGYLLAQLANMTAGLYSGGVGNLHYYAANLITPLLQFGVGAYLFLDGEWVINFVIPSNRPYCPECGYDLTGSREPLCPECGTHVPAGLMP